MEHKRYLLLEATRENIVSDSYIERIQIIVTWIKEFNQYYLFTVKYIDTVPFLKELIPSIEEIDQGLLEDIQYMTGMTISSCIRLGYNFSNSEAMKKYIQLVKDEEEPLDYNELFKIFTTNKLKSVTKKKVTKPINKLSKDSSKDLKSQRVKKPIKKPKVTEELDIETILFK